MPWKWSTKAPMEYSFDREVAMARTSKSLMQRAALAAFALTLAWFTTARADDVLDRTVHFNISAAPLASALIEFSSQSGLQVAAADAEVSHLNAGGVNGALKVRAALGMLLHGTGLEFQRVGAETVVIRTASTGRALEAARSEGAAARMPVAPQAQPDPNAQRIIRDSRCDRDGPETAQRR